MLSPVASTSVSGGRTTRNAILHGAAALATFALVLTSPRHAAAATVLTTPGVPANNGQIPVCVLTNVDKMPITVTVQLFQDQTGKPEPSSNDCPVPPATLAPGTGCQAQLVANIQAYCVVTTSSAKVRAALDLFNGTTSALEVVVPATK
jgi:hypothetical protein